MALLPGVAGSVVCRALVSPLRAVALTALVLGLFGSSPGTPPALLAAPAPPPFVAAPGVSLSGSGVAAWGDYDNDGDLDLFLAGTLYKNGGGGTFTNANAGLPAVSV